jgi:hypothetical protein
MLRPVQLYQDSTMSAIAQPPSSTLTFGGSPLLQQGELDFSSAKKSSISKWALALGFLL